MSSKRVLIIDDEPLIREVIEASLEMIAGWDVLVASSGPDGLAIAATERPDVILLDVSMPGMDGVETFQKLQTDPCTQAIPVLLLTAKVQPTDRERFAALGVMGVLTKPFDPMELTTQIANLLGWESPG